ncbi:MAG TPA: hypothetical protein VK699_00860 [Terriglobales bacterium]|jgi:hypothetical protein|nr:hypothetical protein [Terriglobales bacterium]
MPRVIQGRAAAQRGPAELFRVWMPMNNNFNALSSSQKQDLLNFLRSL